VTSGVKSGLSCGTGCPASGTPPSPQAARIKVENNITNVTEIRFFIFMTIPFKESLGTK
jgi:hypothetical protein